MACSINKYWDPVCIHEVNSFMPCGLFYLNSLDRSITYIRGVWLVFIIITFCRNFWTYCKLCRPWSDAAFCGVWSGSALFANFPFIPGKLGLNGLSFFWVVFLPIITGYFRRTENTLVSHNAYVQADRSLRSLCYSSILLQVFYFYRCNAAIKLHAHHYKNINVIRCRCAWWFNGQYGTSLTYR